MNILFATYPMAFHTPGGGEVQLHAYRHELAARGVGVTLFDLWEPRLLEHDIVHFFSCIGGSLPFCAFVKGLGLPLVVTPNLWITQANRDDYQIEPIRRQLEIADAVIVNSDMEGDTLSDVFELPRALFATVYNGAERAFCDPADPQLFRKRFGIDGRFILNVANLETRKNQVRLAEAMQAFPDHALVVIGHVRDPEYRDRIMAASDRVVHLGALENSAPELRSAYAACDVFAFPGLLETPGIAALEAAAQGARLVVTQVGSTPEYFGDLATYVDPVSTKSIVNGISKVLADERVAPDRALSRLVSERFTWDRVTDRLVSVYEGLLDPEGDRENAAPRS